MIFIFVTTRCAGNKALFFGLILKVELSKFYQAINDHLHFISTKIYSKTGLVILIKSIFTDTRKLTNITEQNKREAAAFKGQLNIQLYDYSDSSHTANTNDVEKYRKAAFGS